MSPPRLLPAMLILMGGSLAAVEVEAAKLATADAMPVAPGAYEVALGASWTRSRSVYDTDGNLQDRDGTYIERHADLGFTAGIVPNLDAGITLGYSRITDGAADPGSGHGPTDISLGAKWRFLERDGLALAVLPEICIPVGDGHPEDEISTGSNLWGAGLNLVASTSVDRLALGAAIGWGCVGGKDHDRGVARGDVHADLAVGWQATDMLQPEIELHYARDLNANDTPDAWTMTATAGILVITDYGRFGAGVDQVFMGRNADRATAALLQWVKGF